MNDLNSVLLSILLIGCIVLVVVLIIVCIKLLYTTEKLNIILNDVEKKLISVNKVFSVIDGVTDALTTITDAIKFKFLDFISSIFNKKKEENENE